MAHEEGHQKCVLVNEQISSDLKTWLKEAPDHGGEGASRCEAIHNSMKLAQESQLGINKHQDSAYSVAIDPVGQALEANSLHRTLAEMEEHNIWIEGSGDNAMFVRTDDPYNKFNAYVIVQKMGAVPDSPPNAMDDFTQIMEYADNQDVALLTGGGTDAHSLNYILTGHLSTFSGGRARMGSRIAPNDREVKGAWNNSVVNALTHAKTLSKNIRILRDYAHAWQTKKEEVNKALNDEKNALMRRYQACFAQQQKDKASGWEATHPDDIATND